MAEIDLPIPFSQEFISLIPRQRAVTDRLMKEKVITSYAVSIEDGKLWTTIMADSEDSAINILSQFPIIEMTEYRIFKLAFHNVPGSVLPQFSLN